MNKLTKVCVVLVLIANSICVIYRENDETCEGFLDYVKAARFGHHSKKKTYVSDISCLICSQPDCDFDGGSCSKTSSTPSIPLYNNILEFGLVGNYLPLLTFADVQINKECYIRTEITNMVDSGIVLIRIFECLIDGCEPNSYELGLKLTDEDRCVQAGLIFMGRNKIYISFSQSCQKVATAFFDSSQYIKIRRNECKFGEKRNKLKVNFTFLQDDTRKIDGVPLALPCNGGGYAVDPNRGTFWNKVECWDYLTFTDFPSNKIGLDFVIERKFGGHEDYRFPIANDDWTLDNIYPSYFDQKGMPMPRNLVRRYRDPRMEVEGLERYGCALVSGMKS